MTKITSYKYFFLFIQCLAKKKPIRVKKIEEDYYDAFPSYIPDDEELPGKMFSFNLSTIHNYVVLRSWYKKDIKVKDEDPLKT